MDGRAWLRRTEHRYDVVTLEPMSPEFAGSNALYSVEFYRLMAARLNPGAVVAQWVPFHIVPPSAAGSITAAFTWPTEVDWFSLAAAISSISVVTRCTWATISPIVVPASRTLLVLAAGTDAAQLVFQSDERNLASLRLGQKARASADAYPRQTFDADVSVELHTALADDTEASYQYGKRYAAICPDRFIGAAQTAVHYARQTRAAAACALCGTARW